MMEKTQIYSRSWDEDIDGWLSDYVVPRDPSFVDLREICIPLEECAKVSLGSVQTSTCEWLDANRFDQAAVEVPGEPLGWRLVATSRLRSLAVASVPLTAATENFLPNDQLRVDSTHSGVDIEALVVGMATRSSALMFTESTNTVIGGPTETTRTVYGLITHADLNNHVIRAGLYDRLSRLERILAQLIELEFADPWDWIGLLNEEAQVAISGYHEVGRRRNIERKPVSAATITHLLTVIERSQGLLSKLGYRSRNEFENTKGPITDIRNRVMHPVRPLVLGMDDVRDLEKVLGFLGTLNRRATGVIHKFQHRSTS